MENTDGPPTPPQSVVLLAVPNTNAHSLFSAFEVISYAGDHEVGAPDTIIIRAKYREDIDRSGAPYAFVGEYSTFAEAKNLLRALNGSLPEDDEEAAG